MPKKTEEIKTVKANVKILSSTFLKPLKTK